MIDIQKHYEKIGEFLMKVNSVEFFVNQMLHKVLTEGADDLVPKEVLETSLEELERQSIKSRIFMIISMLSKVPVTSEDNRKVVIAELHEFSKFYNKHIRNLRDFVAHNTLIQVGTGEDCGFILIPSRQGGKKEVKTIEDIEKAIEESIPKIESLFYQMSTFFNLFENNEGMMNWAGVPPKS